MAKKKAKKAAKKETLVYAAKLKRYISDNGGMSAGDLLDAVNDALYCIIDKAIERAKGNNRKIVRGRDV